MVFTVCKEGLFKLFGQYLFPQIVFGIILLFFTEFERALSCLKEDNAETRKKSAGIVMILLSGFINIRFFFLSVL